MNFNDACKTGNIKTVKRFLNKGINIHADSECALKWACYYGKLEVVKLLLENGADIHIDEERSFYLACGSGNLEVIKFLLANGVNFLEIDYDLIFNSNVTNTQAVTNGDIMNYLKNLMILKKLKEL
jgi:ankyrin repeat protein